VRKVAERLQGGGVHTLLDQWDLKAGADMLQYMEESIAAADFVVLVCTPAFGKKANARKGGVGYEQAIVTAELFKDQHTTKFIPVLRQGPAAEALPTYLRSRIYIDFVEDRQFERSLEDLLRVIHGSPAFSRPPLGAVPSFDSQKAAESSPEPPLFSLPRPTAAELKNLVEFGFGSNALNFASRAEAAAWAEKWLKRHPMADFSFFSRVVFAIVGVVSGPTGYGQAISDLAELFMTQHGDRDLDQFAELVDYGYSGDGLDLPTRVAAAEWALRQLRPFSA